MSSDSLVFKVLEVDSEGVEYNRLYIFYDHNLHTFGLRGGYKTPSGITKSYSYYTDSCEGVMDMIRVVSTRKYKLSLCLVNYANLPIVSDDISYSVLYNQDISCNEIVGFDYVKKKNPLMDVKTFLKVLLSCYNDY